MKCSKCGTTNVENAEFCKLCLSLLTSKEKEVEPAVEKQKLIIKPEAQTNIGFNPVTAIVTLCITILVTYKIAIQFDMSFSRLLIMIICLYVIFFLLLNRRDKEVGLGGHPMVTGSFLSNLLLYSSIFITIFFIGSNGSLSSLLSGWRFVFIYVLFIIVPTSWFFSDS